MSDFASEIPNARKIRGKVVENGTHINSLPYNTTVSAGLGQFAKYM